MPTKGRVLVAMSGGVDSSVAAYLLLREGYECIGVTMKLYDNADAGVPQGHTCCSLDDIDDAREVAATLGMPHYVFDFSDEFERCVMRPFIDAYENGRTPNPCIECNRHLKFGRLLDVADQLGCDFIATGHYARIERAGADTAAGGAGAGGAAGAGAGPSTSSRFALKCGLDAAKDQSYVLYAMTQLQLARTLLPLGAFEKPEVRRIAEAQGLVNARKHDSQDICFVPDGDYVGFLDRAGTTPRAEGDIVDAQGRVLGRHRGAVAYTIGQRKGLGVAAREPLYVIAKHMERNEVVAGTRAELMTQTCHVRDWNWIGAPVAAGERVCVQVKTSYRQTPRAATLRTLPSDGGEGAQAGAVPSRVEVLFDEATVRVAPGQAVVAYVGDAVLGGGTAE